MIKKMSNLILQYLLRSDVIDDDQDEKEYYQYGIEITISSILNIVLILAIGLLTHNICESFIFLMLFIPIRQFTGGFHASSYFKCNLSFCIVFLSILVMYNFTQEILSTYLSILITFICIIVIALKCPIENKNKPILEERTRFHKRIAILLSTIYGIIAIVFIAFSYKYGALILYTLLSVTVLIFIALLSGREV